MVERKFYTEREAYIQTVMHFTMEVHDIISNHADIGFLCAPGLEIFIDEDHVR